MLIEIYEQHQYLKTSTPTFLYNDRLKLNRYLDVITTYYVYLSLMKIIVITTVQN